MDFGEELRRLRKEKKLSIRKLGELSEISHAYISQLENGKRDTPKPRLIRKLANALGINYYELMEKAGYIEDGIAGYVDDEEFKDYINEDELKKPKDIFYLLKNEDNVYYNGQQITKDDRQKIVDVLKAILPEYH